MNLRHGLATVLLPAIVGILAIWLAVEHQARRNRARIYQTLERQLQSMAGLVARNVALSNLLAQASATEPLPPDQHLELLRLRGEASVLRRQPADLNQVREENRLVHVVLERFNQTRAESSGQATDDYWPRGTWANSGYGSPEAALKTMIWAGFNGDLTNFFASVADDQRAELKTELAGESETEKSVRLAEETHALQSVQILAREVLDDHFTLLTVEVESPDGFETQKMIMKKTGGEWKFAGPER